MTRSDLTAREPELAEDLDVLWRDFAAAASVESFCSKWLALQCRTIEGVAAGVVLVSLEEDQPFVPAAFWPAKDDSLKRLAEIAKRAITERRGLVLKQAGDQPRFDITYPIRVSGRIYAVVALDVDPRDEQGVRTVLRQLQWGAAWMEVLFFRGQTAKAGPDATRGERLDVVVNMLASLLSQENFQGAATAFVTALATRLECDRVSAGFLRGGNIRVEALSHSARFGKETSVIRSIAEAMEEAADQDSTIVYPEPLAAGSLVTRGHAELARQYGNGSICSIPLRGSHDTIGVLTLERPEGQSFDADAITVCESICALAGPILEVQRRDDRWLARKILDSTQTHVGYLIGPRHIAVKLGAFITVAVILFFMFARSDYRVTAKTVIEPFTRQALVAAFDGYIRTAPAKAGDVVKKDQVLATLDERDLKLERNKWQSQQEQTQKQYYEALGNRNAADVQIFGAQIAQAKAQVALLDEQLARTQVTTPFDGVIVAGDLSQTIGSPIQRGQVLFEVAPLDSYRIVLQVDEREIRDIAVGQRGRLVLAGSANDPLDFSVGRLTPVSTSTEGRNFFRVEAQLDRANERLRPGMEGVGKIVVGRQRLIWIWTHEVIDWLRLKIWDWMP